MQEAGHELERSTALGVLMDNEERRLTEAVRRCDVWATCASLVLGVQVEILVGTAGAEDFSEWSHPFQAVYTASSALSLMCMGWVAYDVLRAAEEAQALAHARPVCGGSYSWLKFDKAGRRIDGGIYPPLETMRAAVTYLHQCLRDMRQVFSVGLLMSAVTFFCFIGTHSPPDSVSFIVGVVMVVVVTLARQVWRRRLRRSFDRAPAEEDGNFSHAIPDGRVGGSALLFRRNRAASGRTALKQIGSSGRLSMRRSIRSIVAREATELVMPSTPESSCSGRASQAGLGHIVPQPSTSETLRSECDNLTVSQRATRLR